MVLFDPAETILAAVRAMVGAHPGVPDGAAAIGFVDGNRDDILTAIRHRLGTIPLIPQEGDPDRWTEKQRRAANVMALRVLRKIEGRPATAQEQAMLAAYSGWGGIQIESLPDDKGVLDEAQRRALRGYLEWRAQYAKGKATLKDAPDVSAFEGVITQYFTPYPLIEAMWGLAQRVGFRGGVALEPSAGVGRFLARAPENVSWVGVEYDAVPAQILALNYPGAVVFNASFESFSAANKNWRADIIIANPPYAKHAPFRGHDPQAHKWDDEYAYFFDAASRLLNPGGLLVFLTPSGFLYSRSGQFHKLRETLLRRCHFYGAAPITNEVFSGANLRTAVSVWVRRAEELREVRDEDRAVLEGNYLPQMEDIRLKGAEGLFAKYPGLANSVGTWARGDGSDGRPKGKFMEPYLYGDFDGDVLERMLLRPVPRDVLDDVRRAQHNAGPTPAPVAPRKVGADVKVDDGPVLPAEGIAIQSRRLSDRITSFMETAQANPNLAEASRAELRDDILGFVARWGNPHSPVNAKELKEIRGSISDLLAAVDAQDGLRPVFTEVVPSSAPMDVYPSRTTDPVDVVRFYAARRGYCTEVEVQRHFVGTDYHQTLVNDPTMAFERAAYGDVGAVIGTVYYTTETYVRGAVYERLDRVDRALLAPNLPENEQEKLEAQRVALLEAIQPVPAPEIEFGIRDGFIPVEALQDYLNTFDGMARGAPVEVVLKDGLLTASGGGVLTSEIVAYWNHESKTTGRDEKGKQKKGRRGKTRNAKTGAWEQTTDVADMVKQDKERDEHYHTWVVSSEKWAPTVADTYNRTYRGFRPRVRLDTPLLIGRANPTRRPHPYQNQSVRQITDQRGGVIGHAVGLGKTAAAMTAIALWRQQGLARRPLILVPTSLMVNWIEEYSRFYPDYHVLPIGLTVGADGSKTPDNEATRKRKWAQYAQGGCDVALCTYETFRDVDVTPPEKARIFGEEFWLLRDLAKDDRDRGLYQEELEGTEVLLTRVEDALADYRARGDTDALAPWVRGYGKPASYYVDLADQLTQRVAKMQTRVARLKLLLTPVEERIALKQDKERKAAKKEKKEGGNRAPTLRMLEELQAESRAWAEGRTAYQKRTVLAWWENLGCDMLIVDEAHNFKNLWYADKRYGQSVKFMGSSGKTTFRAWDLYAKAACVRKLRSVSNLGDGGGVVLLTATLLSNSPLELYSLLSYVSKDVWTSRGILNKETFVDRYCDIELLPTLSIKGDVQERLGAVRFKHMDELHVALDTYVDIKDKDDVPSSILRVPAAPPLPAVVVPMSPEQVALYEQFREIGAETIAEAEAEGGAISVNIGSDDGVDDDDDEDDGEVMSVSGDEDDPDDDDTPVAKTKGPKKKNPAGELLRLIGLMDKAAIDPRLIDPRKYSGYVSARIEALADNIALQPDCGHIIFVDFNEMHELIKTHLVRSLGINPKRILILSGKIPRVKRQDIANQFNGTPAEVLRGRIIKPAVLPEADILIAQSKVGGEGLNLQARTCGIHHFTLPWEPKTIAQRNGRGVRQGNRFDSVNVYYYLTAESFDGYRFEMIQKKLENQKSLIRQVGRESDNPAAGSNWSSAELFMLFVNPKKQDEVRKRYAAVLEQQARERHRKSMLDAAQALADYVQAGKRILSLTGVPRQETNLRFAQETQRRFRLKLLALPDDVFPHKALLDLAETTPIFWHPTSGSVLVEGRPFCMACVGRDHYGRDAESDISWMVHRMDAYGQAIVVRQAGSLTTTTISFNRFWQDSRCTEYKGECAWSDEDDAKGIEQRYRGPRDHWNDTGTSISTEVLRTIPPSFFPAYGGRIWAAILRWWDKSGRSVEHGSDKHPAHPDGRKMVPFALTDGNVLLVPLQHARDNVRQLGEIFADVDSVTDTEHEYTPGKGYEYVSHTRRVPVPLWPTEEGWTRFMDAVRSGRLVRSVGKIGAVRQLPARISMVQGYSGAAWFWFNRRLPIGESELQDIEQVLRAKDTGVAGSAGDE